MTSWGDMTQAPQIDSNAYGLNMAEVLWLIQKAGLALDLDAFNTVPEERERLNGIASTVKRHMEGLK